jgi:hypothetical protein
VNPGSAAALSISRTSIQRNGLKLSGYIQAKTKALLAKCISVSLMFDEASDIQMNQHLNVFVNVLLDTGEVKTLTLALQGCNVVISYYCPKYYIIL